MRRKLYKGVVYNIYTETKKERGVGEKMREVVKTNNNKGVDEMLMEILEANFKKFEIDGKVLEVQQSMVDKDVYYIEVAIEGEQYVHSTPFDIPATQHSFIDIYVDLLNGKLLIKLRLMYKITNNDIFELAYQAIVEG